MDDLEHSQTCDARTYWVQTHVSHDHVTGAIQALEFECPVHHANFWLAVPSMVGAKDNPEPPKKVDMLPTTACIETSEGPVVYELPWPSGRPLPRQGEGFTYNGERLFVQEANWILDVKPEEHRPGGQARIVYTYAVGPEPEFIEEDWDEDDDDDDEDD